MLPRILTKSSTKEKKPAHHVTSLTGTTYQNPWPSAGKASWSEMLSMSNPFSWYSSHDLHAHERARDISVVVPDWGKAALAQAQTQVDTEEVDCIIGTWLGHAGVMIEMPVHKAGLASDTTRQEKAPRVPGRESIWILVDPIFSERAGPTSYTGPQRMHSSPCTVADLPDCSYVLITHNHYDHLDANTLKAISKRFPACKFLVPLGNAASLPTTISRSQISELDWWDTEELVLHRPESEHSHDADGIKFRFTCVPAQHNSGRTGMDTGSGLWCGWAIEQIVSERIDSDGSSTGLLKRKGAVYHAGDTGYRRTANSVEVCPVFKDIGKKFGPIDLSFLPIWRGGTLGFVSSVGLRLSHNDIPSTFHASPRDAICIHQDVQSRNSVGVHFGTFIGAVEESLEAVIEFDEAGEQAGVARLDEETTGNGRAGVIDIGGSICVRIDEHAIE